MAKEKASEPEAPRRQLHEVVMNGITETGNGMTGTPVRNAKDRGYILKMKLSSFEKNSIYSIDVHPDGTRFAAGGMGEDTGRVCFFHVHSTKPERRDIKLICQLDTHLACVNSVRWSNNGTYLASGAGDALIMIWQQTRLGDQENWKRIHALHRHVGDVLAVSWSPNDAWLASCGVDNTVIIWDAQKSFVVVHVLKEDEGNGMLKGLVWDPIGKYLATQSDERLCIWKTGEWKQHHSSKDYFSKCKGATQVLRLDWSTDGTSVVSAHATNEGRPVAQMIDRAGIGEGRVEENWSSPHYLAGFSRPVVCVRFSPRMYTTRSENSPYCVCATGSRDHSVSVWNFHNKRPHAFPDLFSQPVMDISWFPDGYGLLACSLDGTIAYIHCGKLMTGTAVTRDQQAQCLEKLYGRKIDSTSSALGVHNIVESSIFLAAQEAESQRQKNAEPQQGVTNIQDFQPRLPYPDIPLKTQIETILPNGRRRITPVYIPETVVLPGSRLFGGVSSSQLSSDDRSQSSSTFSEVTKSLTETVPMARPLAPSALESAVRSMEQKPTKNAAENGISMKKAPKIAENSTESRRKEASEPAAKSRSLEAKPKDTSSKGPDVPVVNERKRKKTQPGPESSGKFNNLMNNKPRQLPPTPPPGPPTTLVPSRRSTVPTRRAIPLPTPVSKLSLPVSQEMDETSGIIVNIENDLQSDTGALASAQRFHKVQLMIGNNVIWTQFIHSPVITITADKSVVCGACIDGTLFIFATESGAMLHKHVLPSPATHSACTKNQVLLVLADSKVEIWTRTHLYERWWPTNLGSIDWMLRSSAGLASVAFAGFSTTDVPVVGLSDHRTFACDTKHVFWSLVHDDNVRFGNYLMEQAPLSGLADLKGPLSKLQQAKSNIAIDKKISPDVSRTLLLNHMEQQMQLCQLLKSPSEYRGWLRCLAQSLVANSQPGENNNNLRLKTLLDSLMGPPGSIDEITDGNSNWEPEVLGMSKRSLLKDTVLPVLARNIGFQRMFSEYGQLLELNESRSVFAME